MKYKVFDVVELNDGNKATVLDILKNNTYKVEIVNNEGIRQRIANVSDSDINKPIIVK